MLTGWLQAAALCVGLHWAVAVRIADALGNDWDKPDAPFAGYSYALRALFSGGICIIWPVLLAGTCLRMFILNWAMYGMGSDLANCCFYDWTQSPVDALRAERTRRKAQRKRSARGAADALLLAPKTRTTARSPQCSPLPALTAPA